MTKIPFSTPINTGNNFATRIERYFSFEKNPEEAIISSNGKVAVLSPRFSKEPVWERALRIVSLITGIIPLIVLAIKYLNRSQLKVDLIDSKEHLSRGVKATEETLQKITELMPEMIAHKPDAIERKVGEITWRRDYVCQFSGHNFRQLTFELDSAPGLVFEMHLDPENNSNKAKALKNLYNGLRQVQAICLQNGFTHLSGRGVNLQSISYNGLPYQILVREKMAFEFSSVEIQREQLTEKFFTEKENLKEPLRELIRYIILTGYFFHGESLFDSHDSTKILLFHTYIEPNSPFVKEHLARLAAHLPEELCQFMCEELEAQGYAFTEEQLTKAREETKFDLFNFYDQKGVLQQPDNGAAIPLDDLGLPLDEQIQEGEREWDSETHTFKYVTKKTLSCREVAQALIDRIEANFRAPHEEQTSIADRRRLRIWSHESGYSSSIRSKSLEERGQEKWRDMILRALKEKGHIFDFYSSYHSGLTIQA